MKKLVHMQMMIFLLSKKVVVRITVCVVIVWGIPFQKSSQDFFCGKGLEGKSESYLVS